MNPFLAVIAVGLLMLNVLGYAVMTPYLGRRGSGVTRPVGNILAGATSRLAALQ